jgi:hypothetical protein
MSMELDRLKLVEQKLEVIMKETNDALNQLATSINHIINIHRMFTAYVDTNLTEIREKVGISSPSAPATGEQHEGGKDL